MTRKELRRFLVEIGITAERALALGTTHRLLMCAVAGYKHATGVDGDLPVARAVVNSVELIGAAIKNLRADEADVLSYLRDYAATAKQLGLEASARNRSKLEASARSNGLNGKTDGRKTRHIKNPPSKLHPFRTRNNARVQKAMARKIKPSEVF